jgi:hypothetical protein
LLQTLVRSVVEVDKVLLPLRGIKSVHVNGVSVVLRSDVAATSGEIKSGNVMGTVSVFQLDGLGTCGQGKKLVSKTDTHDGTGVGLHQLAEVVHGGGAVSWVTRSIGTTAKGQ